MSLWNLGQWDKHETISGNASKQGSEGTDRTRESKLHVTGTVRSVKYKCYSLLPYERPQLSGDSKYLPREYLL